MAEIVGWFSSVVLLATIISQISRQWKQGTSEGVSRWLFIGQATASAGFTIYSWFLGSWVFIFTNGLMFLSAIVGLLLLIQHRRRRR